MASAMHTKILYPFESSVQAISAIGAVVALITISLILFTAYLGYKVYYKGELHFKESPEAGAGQKAAGKEYNPEEKRVPER